MQNKALKSVNKLRTLHPTSAIYKITALSIIPLNFIYFKAITTFNALQTQTPSYYQNSRSGINQLNMEHEASDSLPSQIAMQSQDKLHSISYPTLHVKTEI